MVAISSLVERDNQLSWPTIDRRSVSAYTLTVGGRWSTEEFFSTEKSHR